MAKNTSVMGIYSDRATVSDAVIVLNLDYAQCLTRLRPAEA